MSIQKEVQPSDLTNQSPEIFHLLDDRIPVSDPSVYPYRTVGHIIVELTDGRVFTASGSLLSDYTVLTAGHAVMSADNEFYDIQSLRFIPARNHSDEPYGRFDWRSMRAIRSGARDWCLIELAAAAGFRTGYLGWHARLPLSRWVGLDDLSHIGFPGDHADEMWIDEEGEVESIDEQLQLRTSIDAAAGQSGGPLARNWFGTNPQVIGSLVEGPNPVENPNDFMPGWETSTTQGWVHHLCTDFGNRNPDDRFEGCDSVQVQSSDISIKGKLPKYSAESRLANDYGPTIRRFPKSRSLRMTPRRASSFR